MRQTLNTFAFVFFLLSLVAYANAIDHDKDKSDAIYWVLVAILVLLANGTMAP